MKFKSWLTKKPQPAQVQLADRKIPVPAGRKKWGDILDTIAAAAKPGDRVLALDAEGNLLRATQYQPDEEDEETIDVSVSGQMSDTVMFARIIADSNDRAVMRASENFQRVLDSQISLMQLFANRVNTLENAFHKQMLETSKANASLIQVQAAAEAAQSEDILTQALAPIVGQMLAGQQKNGVKTGGS